MRRALHAALTTFLAAGLLLAGQQANAAPDADAPASTFTSRSPVRVLDTRTGTGTGGSTSPVGPGGTITVDLAAEVPATATAVVLNVTGVTPTAATFVTVFPGGTSRPTASSLNLAAGDTKPNQVTVALGADRRISLYNNNGNVHLVADIAGHYATEAGAKFTALPLNRLLDTRSAGGPVGPGATKVVDLTDRIPVSATAVTFNLTATNPTAATFVTAWPTGTTRPNASNLNVVAGETRPNLVTVAVGADRLVSLYNNAGQTDLIVDLNGFYTPDYGAFFVPLPPTRVLDTRNGTGGTTGPVGSGAKIALDLAGPLALTSTGVVLNVTGVDATAATYVTVFGRYGGLPNASVLNLAPGQTAPNAATVAFGNRRGIELYNNNGNVHLVADLAGVFTVAEPSCVDDCVLAWGANSLNRSLGTAETVFSSSTPTAVAGLSGVRAVDGGSSENGYALRTDGTVWAWGNNEGGQLGNGWTSTWSGGYGGGSVVPVPVQGLTSIVAIAGSGYGAYALRADGRVFAWGAGSAGQLGTGVTDHASTPVQVGLTNVVAIAGGWNTGYAVRSDGTVWAWGFNGNGNLGNGSTTEYASTPVQVPGLTGVTAISAQDHGAYVLRADGTIWAWGYNGAGQLGNGQPCALTAQCVSRVPVQVSGLTGVTAIAGSVNNGFAARNDGTAWAWGSNYQGALGNGVECDPTTEVCESRVPVQVSNLDDVTQVVGFSYGGYALRADGTVRAWGPNSQNALGNYDVSGHSAVPVPVVGVSGASGIGAGWESGFALVPNP